MQPFSPVDAVRLMYQEKMRPDLARQQPGSSLSMGITTILPLRSPIERGLASSGMRIDPTSRYLFQPGFA